MVGIVETIVSIVTESDCRVLSSDMNGRSSIEENVPRKEI